MALYVFEEIFNARDRTHKQQRKQNGWLSRRDRDLRNNLQEHDEQEVDVGHLRELLEQVLRQESQPCVLRSADGVRC